MNNNILFFLTPKAMCAYLYDDYTMRQALENLIHRFGIDPADAVRMCTRTPAESIGEEALGRMVPGSPAPLSRWSGDWRFVSIIDEDCE